MIRRNEQQRQRRAGFTLMEILIVVAIIIVLVGVGGVSYFTVFADTKKDTASLQIKALMDACGIYSTRHNGNFPDSLEQLLQKDETGGPWLESRDKLIDPWGRPYQYQKVGTHNQVGKPDISTQAPDGTMIGSWPKGM
jgi:general secretion pathway protein G